MEAGEATIRSLAKDEAYFFKNNLGSTDIEKQQWLEKRLSETLLQIDSLSLEDHISSYLKGRALNVGNSYSEKAESILVDAAKMNPTMFELWNELGDCIWKKGDKKGARNCFERALSQQKNKVSLRNLSIVMRHKVGLTKEEIEETVQISKEAVSLDVSDGTSWYILGNAYLAQFFLCGQASNVLKCSLNAYTKASDDEKVLSDPDYYYNKAIVSKYLDDYRNAISYFTEALSIDPRFSDCQKELEGLKDQIVKTHGLVVNKGKLKAKKVGVLMKNLKEKSCSQNPTTQVTMVPFNDLENGPNKDKAINCVLVSSVVPVGQTPFVCICLDTQYTCFAVNIYNIDTGKAPKLGDILTIPFPQRSTVDMVLGSEEYTFNMLRVDSPLQLMVNNRQLSNDVLAPLKLTTTAMT